MNEPPCVWRFICLKSPRNLTTLSEALCEVRDRVTPCSICFAITEGDPCAICSGTRDAGTICVVENSQDLMALERSNAFHGVYHVLERCHFSLVRYRA